MMSEKNKTRRAPRHAHAQSSMDPLAHLAYTRVHMGLKKEYKLVNKNI